MIIFLTCKAGVLPILLRGEKVKYKSDQAENHINKKWKTKRIINNNTSRPPPPNTTSPRSDCKQNLQKCLQEGSRHRPPSTRSFRPDPRNTTPPYPRERSSLANNPNTAPCYDQSRPSDGDGLFNNASKEEKDSHRRQHRWHRPPSKNQACAQSLMPHHLYRLRGGSQATLNLRV